MLRSEPVSEELGVDWSAAWRREGVAENGCEVVDDGVLGVAF